jgi:hypothetical protein
VCRLSPKAAAKGPPKGSTLASASDPPNVAPERSTITSKAPAPPPNPQKAAPRKTAVNSELLATSDVADECDIQAYANDQAHECNDNALYSERPPPEEEWLNATPCKFFAKGRCLKGLHCLFAHDEENRVQNDFHDNPKFARCADHGYKRSKIYLVCANGVWRCDPDDKLSYCLRERIDEDEKQPKPPSRPPPNKDTDHIGAVSKTTMQPPKYVPKPAPREKAPQKNPKKVSPLKETPSASRDGPRRTHSASPPPAAHRVAAIRSRSPGPRGRRPANPKEQTVPTAMLSRNRSHSRSRSEEATNGSSPSSKSHSPVFTESRKTKKKKATPQSRSRSRAPDLSGVRIAARAASDRNSARTAAPYPQPFEDRAVKEQGVYLNGSQPKCKLGHTLTYPYVSALVPHVQPSCYFCPRVFVVGSTICVCHQCEPIYFACVRCTFKLPITDDDQD